MHRLRQGASPYGADRANDLGSVRGGATKARPLCREVRWIPRGAGISLEDLPGALRQQQVLGDRQRGRASGRGDTIYDPWHYVPVLARKPGALRNGAPFKDWVLPAAMERVRRKLAGADDG